MKTTRLSLLMAGFVSVAAGCQPEEPVQAPASALETREAALDGVVGTWTNNAPMLVSLSGHTANLLNGTGEVMVTQDGFGQIYDPYANTWRTAGNFEMGRWGYTVTELSSRKLLVAGGALGGGMRWMPGTRLYNPATGEWEYSGSMNTARFRHTATLLDSGKVLVAGGFNTASGSVGHAELYDPDTGTWSSAGHVTPRDTHTATRLYSGKVLVTGGQSHLSGNLSLAELYDPATNTWSFAGGMSRWRVGHLALRLYSGYVMVLGGAGADNSVDMFNPYSESWSLGPALPISGPYATATMLYSGEVLVTNTSGQAAVYDPSTNAWLLTAPMNQARANSGAVLLHTGEVLVTGGYYNSGSGSGALSSVERFAR